MPIKRFNKHLLLFGLTLISISVIWNLYQIRVLSFDQYTEVPSKIRQENLIPKTIQIKELNINLPLIESKIKNGVWEISPKGGSHLSSSSRPGEGGNIIIYGHNKKNIFGSLVYIKKGDEIKISTDKNEYIYQVYETKIVNPRDVSVLNQTSSEELTLYTCTGFLDSKRFIVKAKLN